MTSVRGQPKLIISVYGGHKHFTMDGDIEKEFMDSLAEVAVTSGFLLYLNSNVKHEYLRYLDHNIWIE